MSIIKYEIDMFNVKSADAILIHCFNEKNAEYIVLVDAGCEEDGKIILEYINSNYESKKIDIAICTHPDKDHYGGFKRLLEEHDKEESEFEIKKFWIHDPSMHVNTEDVKRVRKEETLRERVRKVLNFSDGSNLLDMIDERGIQRIEPFADTMNSVLGITVLGPEEVYYENLVPNFRIDNLDFIEDEEDEDDVTGPEDEVSEKYSKALDEAGDDPSAHNQSSVIFTFEPNDGKVYLFAGDAGIEALNKVFDRDSDTIKDVHFFKVPHHGSKHNLSNALISHIKPEVSFISTEKYGKYMNHCTVYALKKSGSDVFSSHNNGMMKHSFSIFKHGYIPAVSL